jgi:hypothetical protein
MGQVTFTSTTADSFECPKCYFVSHNRNDIANLYCIRCHQFVEDMRSERVTDFAHITKLYLTRKDCYTLALLALTDSGDPQARLVHGWCMNSFTGKLSEHAWVEMPATATYEDGSEGPITVAVDYTQINERTRIVPAHLLYEAVQPRDCKRFTLAEAMAHAAAKGDDGPWDTAALAPHVARLLPKMEQIAAVSFARAKSMRQAKAGAK